MKGGGKEPGEKKSSGNGEKLLRGKMTGSKVACGHLSGPAGNRRGERDVVEL